MKKYQIILVDPPWTFKTYSEKGKRAKYGWGAYPTMSDKEICDLPIGNIASDNCVLFLWITYPKLESAFKVIKSWGFEYKTVAFTWIKQNKNGKGLWLGLGYWTRANAEICLLATKGNPKRIKANVKQVIISPRQKHSEKPAEIRDRIVKLMGDLPRIELFARKENKLFDNFQNWDVWGNEVKSDIDLESLAVDK